MLKTSQFAKGYQITLKTKSTLNGTISMPGKGAGKGNCELVQA